jgi:ribosomal protein S18 acetylase RimI-like enzyme
MRIIRASIEHLELLLPLYRGYLSFYQRPPDDAKARAFLAERLTRQDSAILLALHGHDTSAGFVQLYPVFSSLRMSRAWILNDLFVDPAYRRHSVARSLLDAANAHARETGASHLELQTARDNSAARSLYESMGWVHDEGFLTYSLDLTAGGARNS